MTSNDRELLRDALLNVRAQLDRADEMRASAHESRRTLINQAFNAGFSMIEIAEILGVSRQAVYLVVWGR